MAAMELRGVMGESRVDLACSWRKCCRVRHVGVNDTVGLWPSRVHGAVERECRERMEGSVSSALRHAAPLTIPHGAERHQGNAEFSGNQPGTGRNSMKTTNGTT